MDTKYFYSDINLDITHRCVLQCPRCLRQQHPGMHKRGYDITIESFSKICDHFESINFCGQMGDCIYHPKFLELIKIAYEKNIKVKAHTNGHGKTKLFWQEAFQYKNIRWIFALDGLPKDSNKYRINQDGEYVWEIMKMGKKMGVNITWQYIPFLYNEEHIDEAIQMAKDNDMRFMLKISSRHPEGMTPSREDLKVDRIRLED